MGEMIRVNTRVSKDVNDWLDNESKRTGVAKSTLIYLALEQYINQKRAISAMDEMKELVERMESLETKVENVVEWAAYAGRA